MAVNLEKVLVPRVPVENRPIPLTEAVLAKCGPAGHLVESTYEGQKFPYGLFRQVDHGCLVLLIAHHGDMRWVGLVRQWRPTHDSGLELPAGGAGLTPEQILVGTLKELGEEVGDLEITSARVAKGITHDAMRKVVQGGGGMCFFPFIIEVALTTPPKEYHQDDERVKSVWVQSSELPRLIAEGQIHDMPAIALLALAGLISWSDLQSVDITKEMQAAQAVVASPKA